MFDKIKRLGTDTAIYGVSTILGRFLTFILTPLYANILVPSELGVVATVFAYLAFLNVIYSYGMESAYFKYSATLEIGDTKQNFAVPFTALLFTSTIFSLVIIVLRLPLATAAGVPTELSSIVLYSAGILALDAWSIIPFASLRLARKAKLFASIRLAGILITVILNVLFLIVFEYSVEGIFLSNLIGSACTFTMLLPVIFRNMTAHWNKELLPALLKFGLPYVPAGIATMVIQVVDRPILESLTDKATVGVYQANYRLGIFMMLIVSTVDFAWRPFFLTHANDPEAKPLFARILTYYFLVMVCVFLTISFFIGDVVRMPLLFGRSILPESYWQGLAIIPVVMLGYLFLGISGNMSAGIYIEKKTKLLPPITFFGAGVNIAANYLLIPTMGIMGAAIATLLSYALMAIALYVVVRRFYPVQYEFERMAKIACAALIVYGMYFFFLAGDSTVLFKVALLFVFLFLMHSFKFFIPSELGRLAAMFTKRSHGSVLPPDGPSAPEP
ncbi:MAG: polysaccharide biosynthesis C-terminal domain-containing protein [Bacteroidota bacterium]